MPSNTTYNPENIKDFNKSALHFLGKSVAFTCAAGANANGVLTLEDDVLLTGGILLVSGGKINDKIFLDVLAPNDALLLTFVDGYRVDPNNVKQTELALNYPAKLFTGFKVRVRYEAHADGGTRDVALNFYLHKVLV